MPHATPRTAVLLAALTGAVAGVSLTTAPALGSSSGQAPDAGYEMPFPCGQSWTGTTRASHSPSSKAIDWNRPDDVDDPVVAAAPGVVTTADTNGRSGYGRWVRIDHGNGESTVYAHLSSVVVKVGQSVDQGGLIGTLGTTGNSSGPHLHFEERDGSSVVTPYFHGQAFAMGSTLASQNCVDVPLAGNFVGDRRADLVVYRRATRSTFQIMRTGKAPKVVTLGVATDQPVAGDWDGDGRTDPGVRSPATSIFTLLTPAGTQTVTMGAAADQPIAGDWDGDGTWEVGVRKAGKATFKLRAATGQVGTVALGDADDVPVTGDWDGNGKTDLGAWNPGTATFSLRQAAKPSAAKVTVSQVQFGRAR